MIYGSADRQNKLISKFSVSSKIGFVNYACFTAPYCCLDHYAWHLKINNSANEFARNILYTNMYLKASTAVKMLTSLEKNGR